MTDTRTVRTLADEALAYASRGIKIFPLWHCVGGICQCADHEKCGSPGKHPRTRNGVSGATHDETRVSAWWAVWPAANIGLAAGANGLAIIDVDPRHGGDASLEFLCTWASRRGVDLTDTYTVRTGSGGLHLYYRQPFGGIKTAPRSFGSDGIDTRGRGGYVVAPPSVHACGGTYDVIHRRSLAPWPECLTYLMEPEPTTVATPQPAPAGRPAGPIAADRMTRRLRAWALSGYQRELEALPSTGEGGRNDALNRAAYRAGLRLAAGLLPGHTEGSITADLYQATTRWRDFGDRERYTTIRSGLEGARGKGSKLILPGWATGWTPDATGGAR
jgi:hypothetical protein